MRTTLKQGYLDVTLELTTSVDEIKSSAESYNTTMSSSKPYVEQYDVGFDRQGGQVKGSRDAQCGVSRLHEKMDQTHEFIGIPVR